MAYESLEVRRRQFIDAASKVIRDEGIAKATTRRIAKEANVSVSVLHYCFQDKEELFEAVSQQFGDEGLALATLRVVPKMGVAKAAGEIMRALGDWITDSETYAREIGEFEFYSWAMRSEAHQGIPRRIYEKWIGGVTALLATSATGSDKGLDLDAIARTLIAMVDGFFLQDGLLRETRMVGNLEVMVAVVSTAIEHGDFRRVITAKARQRRA